MSTATRPAPWWRTVVDPPCPAWCDNLHEDDSFADGGAMLHRREIAVSFEPALFCVEVQMLVSTDDDDTEGIYVTSEMTIWHYCRSSDSTSTAHAEAYARALLAAVEFIGSTEGRDDQ